MPQAAPKEEPFGKKRESKTQQKLAQRVSDWRNARQILQLVFNYKALITILLKAASAY